MADDDDKKKESESAAVPALVAIPLLAWWWSEQHQIEQEQIAAATASGLALLWPLLAFDSLDTTVPGWLQAVTLLIERQWNESRKAGFEFFNRSLLAVEPDAVVAQVMADVPFPVGQVQTAMRVTGPVEVKKQIARAVPEADALAAGKDKSEGAGVTRAADGGRAQVMTQVEDMAEHEASGDVPDSSGAGQSPPTQSARRPSGRRAIGWARVTDDKPCYFCAILASKGAVYLSEGAFKHTDAKYSGKGTAKVHDHCMCSMRPVFSKADSKDARALFFEAQWKLHGKATASDSAENNFRKHYVLPPPRSVSGLSDVERERVLSDARDNRAALLARGYGANSPNVKFYDESLRRLSAA